MKHASSAANIKRLDASRLRSFERIEAIDTAKIADRHPHGVRVKYIGGCRCMLCRAANSRYECDRSAARQRGESNEIVSADTARKHLFKLSKAGIGKRAVAAASDVGYSIIHGIRVGKRMHIRRQTEAKILAVTKDASSDRAYVDAAPAWKQINELLDEGFTKTALAARLGCGKSIQFRKDRMTATNVARVDRFYRLIMAESFQEAC